MLSDDRGPGPNAAATGLAVDNDLDRTGVRRVSLILGAGNVGDRVGPADKLRPDALGAKLLLDATPVRFVLLQPHPVTTLNVASV